MKIIKRIASLVLLPLVAFAAIGANLGDYATATNICGKFTTFRPTTGAAFTLAGTPALSVYKDTSTTQSTTGVTLTADFDAVTGLNHFCIDTSADGTFYSAASNFDIVITTGTVDSVSVVGAVVANFTLNKTSALRPATANRTIVVSAGGVADANVTQYNGVAATSSGGRPEVNVTHYGGSAGTFASGIPSVDAIRISGDTAAADNVETAFDDTAGAVRWFNVVDQGTAQAATATTLQLRAAAAFADSELVGANVVITGGTTGVGQARTITAYVGATDTATVANWTTTPTGTITYRIEAVPPGAGGSVSIAAGGISASSFAAGAIDASAIATNAIGSAEIADGAIDEATFACSGGSFDALGIIDCGTAQAATATTLQLRAAAAFADSEIIGATCFITGGTVGVGQSRVVTAYVGSTDTATVSSWTTTPTGTITYVCIGTAASSGSVSIAAGGISASSFASGAIDANAIATDAIGAAEIAPDAIGASELATDAIGSAEVAATVSTELLAGLAGLPVNATQISGDSTAADNVETAYDDTAGPVRWDGVADQGTAQSASSTTIVLRSAAAFADDELIGSRVFITGGSAGVGQSRTITDYVGSTDTATVSSWQTVPTGTITYKVYSDSASSGGGGGGGPSAGEIADAVLDEDMTAHQTQGSLGQAIGDPTSDTDSIWTLVNANLDTTISSRASASALSVVASYVDTEIADMKLKIDQLNFSTPSRLDVNVESMNGSDVCGSGDPGDAWRGC